MHILSGTILVLGLWTSALEAKEMIFDFSKKQVKTSTNDSGWTGKVCSDGLEVTFAKWEKGANAQPVITIPRKDMKNADWSQYNALVLRLSNLAPEDSPYLNIKFLSGTQSVDFRQRIRGNCTADFAVRIDRLAEKLPLNKIDQVQIIYAQPKHAITLKLQALYLDGKPQDMISGVVASKYDILKEVASHSPGWNFVGSGGVSFDSSNVMTYRMEKYMPGRDKWPGLRGLPDGQGSLLNGDFSTKTHVLIDFKREASANKLNDKLGLTIKDINGKIFYYGLGCGEEKRTVLEVPLYQMGVDLENIGELTLGAITPPVTDTFTFYRFELVFHPEFVADPVVEKLRSLLAEKLSNDNRRQVDDSIRRITKTYDQVKGERASRQKIREFFAVVDEGNRVYNTVTRQHSLEQMRQSSANSFWGVGVADSMEKVFLNEAAVKLQPATGITLELAQNETECTQLAVAVFDGKKRVIRVSAGSIKGPGNAEIQTEIAPVGHSLTRQPTYRVDYVGYYPDFIMDGITEVPVAPGDTVAFWLRFRAAKDIPSGIYQGEVSVCDEARHEMKIPVKIKVFNFCLPDGYLLPTAYDLGFDNIRRVYKPENNAVQEWWQNRMMEKTLKYKINPDFLYRGLVSACIPVLKKAASENTLEKICLTNVSVAEHVLRPDDPEVRKALDKAFGQLEKNVALAQKSGLMKYCYIYGFDEGVAGPVMDHAFAEIKKRYPSIPIMTTVGLNSAENPYIKNIDIQVYGAEGYLRHPELNQALRQQGKQVWWYVCNFPRPPAASFLLELPLTAPRLLMGAMAQKYRPQGFLYYETILWYQKERSPVAGNNPRTNWDPATYRTDNGDGNLFVPGEKDIFPTIRVENMRDGVEDLWYYHLLENAVKQARQKPGFDPELLAEAEKALVVPDSLVRHISEYSTDAQSIRRVRTHLAEMIEKMNTRLNH